MLIPYMYPSPYYVCQKQKLSTEHTKNAQLTHLSVELLLFLFLLHHYPNISHRTPLHSKTWQTIPDAGLTDMLHDGAVHPIVGLSCITVSRNHTGEHHKMAQMWAHMAGQHVQVTCCQYLGSCRSDKVCLSLILEEPVLQHLKIMNRLTGKFISNLLQ